MKHLSYLLILILLLVQLDDSWAIANILPTGPLPEDSQEYLPSQLRTPEERSSTSQSPVFTLLEPQSGHFSCVRRCVPCDLNLVATFSSPLYMFMSLQI
jgi:hypothetical protein